MERVRQIETGLGVRYVSFLIFFIGMIVGVFCANYFVDLYQEQLISVETDLELILSNYAWDRLTLLCYILLKQYKQFFLLWVLSITILGFPYLIYFIVKIGFSFGFLLAAFTIQYSGRGVLVFLAFLFPQYIIYIPVYLITLIRCYLLCKHMGSLKGGAKKNYLIEQLGWIFTLGILLAVGILLEGYINSFVIQRLM